MTDIKEKIAWIWWKMWRFVSMFTFVCVCCESETKKEKLFVFKIIIAEV